jgi:hypothetical protein
MLFTICWQQCRQASLSRIWRKDVKANMERALSRTSLPVPTSSPLLDAQASSKWKNWDFHTRAFRDLNNSAWSPRTRSMTERAKDASTLLRKKASAKAGTQQAKPRQLQGATGQQPKRAAAQQASASRHDGAIAMNPILSRDSDGNRSLSLMDETGVRFAEDSTQM